MAVRDLNLWIYICLSYNSSRYNSNHHHHHCSLPFPYKAKRNCFNLWETLKEEVVDFIFIFLFHVCVARRSNAMKHLCNHQTVFYNICMVTYHTNIVTMTTNYTFTDMANRALKRKWMIPCWSDFTWHDV